MQLGGKNIGAENSCPRELVEFMSTQFALKHKPTVHSKAGNTPNPIVSDFLTSGCHAPRSGRLVCRVFGESEGEKKAPRQRRRERTIEPQSTQLKKKGAFVLS